MSIKNTLRRILYENFELTEDELFEQAVDQELDSAINDATGSELVPSEEEIPQDKSPDEQLDDLVPELSSSLKEKSGNEEQDIGKVKIFIPIYKSKIVGDEDTAPIPVNQVIRHMKKHFDLDSELQAKVEKIFRTMAGEEIEEPAPNPLVEEANKYLECITPMLALSFRPAGGMESPEFSTRTKDLTSSYIDRVNGKNIEINAALNEMKALFDLDDDMSLKLESIFKIASGSLDESSLAFIKENLGGTTSDAADDTMVEPAGDPMASMDAEVTEPETGNESPMSTDEPIAQEPPPESTIEPVESQGTFSIVEENNSPGFYGEYKNIFETIDEISDQINVKNGLKEQQDDGYDFTYIRETLARAATVAMKHGAAKYPKEPVLEQIMDTLHEEFNLDQELNESVSNAIRQSYEIGNNYNEEFLKNSDLYDECKSVDMTVSLNEIIDLFAETPDDEEVLELSEDDDTMEKEIPQKEEINYNSFFGRKIQDNF